MATQPSAIQAESTGERALTTLREIVAQHLAALALRDSPAGALSVPSIIAVLVIHLAGLVAFWRYYHQPLWLAPITLCFLLIPPLLALRWRRGFGVESLAPLLFLYGILIARVIAVRVLLANEPYQDEASFADPRFIAFQVEATAAAVIGYTALCQAVRLTRDAARTRVLLALAAALGIAALVWFGLEAIGHRTRGVTATDPYAYAQMAVDLATRGTPLHSFALFPYVANLNVSWYPIEHIGYRLFGDLTGQVATVWPVGGSGWLALAYRLWGEEGLYIATPLAALASLLVFSVLVWEYLRDKSVVERGATAAIALALLATSWEQVDRSIVPLVDVQAQLFTVLAILFALRGARGQGRWWLAALVTGLSLGAAYFIRHTQVLLAVPIAIAVWGLPWRERTRFLAVAAVAALLVALPDLWYHHQTFGGWLTPESEELALFSWSGILPSLSALNLRFSAGNEFGYVIPFLLYGIWRGWREANHSRFAVIAAWVVVLGGFHLLYVAVKIRDLLPEYPAVILLTSYGMIALGRDVRNWAGAQSWRQAVAALAVFAIFLLPAMRDRLTILRPFQPVKVTFGYVTEAQRASYTRIAELTPANAVIGSTMNDGPIDLYAQRATFRPGAWQPEEQMRFIQIMARENRPVYILNDGAETSAARAALAAHYSMQSIAVLDVPLFGDVQGTAGELVKIVQ